MCGTSITLIGHVTKDNSGIEPLPLTLNVSDETPIELSDKFAAVPHVEDIGGEICLTPIAENGGWPTKTASLGMGEDAWLNHVLRISKYEKVDDKWLLDEVPVTFAGVFLRTRTILMSSHKQ